MIFLELAKNRADEIIELGNYHPYWIDQANRVRNPDFVDRDGFILDVKSNEQSRKLRGVYFFYKELVSLIGCEFAIAAVPSSNPENIDSGICQLARKLAASNRVDATSCLVRHTEIQKLSHGGDRSFSVHLNSIKVIDHHLISGKEVLLLDDVTTTGNSLRACQQLLNQAGAKVVQCCALGKTSRISHIEEQELENMLF